MAYLENASKSTGRKGLSPGQLLAGLNCKARGHKAPCAAAGVGSAAPSLMPMESAHPNARGPYSAAPSQHGVSCPGTLDTKGANAGRSCGAREGESGLPSDKDQDKRSLGRARHPRRPLEPAGAVVLSRTLGRAKHPCVSWLGQQLPTDPSSWRICLGMFGWRLPCATAAFAIARPPSTARGRAKVLVLGSSAAARPLGCLRTGTVGWGGKVEGGWGM